MAWWGKIVGGTFGFMLGGPLGALLGASFGHRFDVASGADDYARLRPPEGDQERVQTAFFIATFAVMGHIAKADGRVTRDEIALAERVMSHMNLNAAQRRFAQDLFKQGRAADFAMDEVLAQFRRECHRRENLMQMFLEIQIQAALADGIIAAAEREILRRAARALGVTGARLDELINFIRGGESHGKNEPVSLANAYKILGVKRDAPLSEVRKSYRRLLSQHHPDKLVSKGLPEEMVQLANEKTHEIRSAWERIKAARK